MENLEKRHLHRNPNISQEELRSRLEYAQYEIDNEAYFYDFKVVNAQNKLKEALKDIIEIIKKEGYKLEK